ncbi:hypothetical protein NE865_01100 [Phthorimaea operculella]|nr:hypothetical protein NE865_01100 [Phthorimaea operculella]
MTIIIPNKIKVVMPEEFVELRKRLQLDFSSIVQWVKSSAGKLVAVVHGYTFNLNAKGRRLWRCSRHGSCKASFSVDSNWTVTRCNLNHDHVPPKYIIRDGVIIKL